MSAKRANPTVLLYNPSCSKCRAAKALLAERGVEFEERRYLEDPLSLEELRDLRRKLDRPPAAWIRAKEDEYEAAGLGPDSSDEELLRAIAEQPILLERPILVRGAKARVGRPVEDLLELFRERAPAPPPANP